MFARARIIRSIALVFFLVTLTTSCSEDVDPTNPPVPNPPFAVEDLCVSEIGPDYVDLEWSLPGNNSGKRTVEKLEVRWSTRESEVQDWNTAEGIFLDPVEAGSVQTFRFDDLDPDHPYYVGIRLSNALGEQSSISNIVPISVVPVPFAIEDLRKTGDGPDWVELEWTIPSVNIDSRAVEIVELRYSLFESDILAWTATQGASLDPEEAGISQSYRLTDLSQGHSYFVGIRLLSHAGDQSSLSNVIQVSISSEFSAIYVSSELGSDFQDGTNSTQPVKTLTRGIQNALNRGIGQVLVASGNYYEYVQLESGISIMGGFDPQSGWVNSEEPTIITGEQIVGGIRTSVVAQNIFEPTKLMNVMIQGPNGYSANPSTVALLITSSPGLSVENCIVVAGEGGPGVDGPPGIGYSTTAGYSGGNGGLGGRRGNFGPIPPHPGEPGNPHPPGIGGVPGEAGNLNHLNGFPGGGGGEGILGLGGLIAPYSGAWSLASDYPIWTHSEGGIGNTGGKGGGGGGGGGAWTGFGCQQDELTGGSGGRGGRGGKGGSGGLAGGASVGAAVVNSEGCSLISVQVVGGNGGEGGKGGNGNSGQAGQLGSEGEICTIFDRRGGIGGNGGTGGRGGGGAGGNGGPSIGLLVIGPDPTQEDLTINIGTGGMGGTGGSGGQTGQTGSSGEAHEQFRKL